MDAVAIECGETIAIATANSHHVQPDSKPTATVKFWNRNTGDLAEKTGQFSENSTLRVASRYKSFYCPLNEMTVRVHVKKALFKAELGTVRLDVVVPGWDMNNTDGGLAKTWHLCDGPLHKYAGLSSGSCNSRASKSSFHHKNKMGRLNKRKKKRYLKPSSQRNHTGLHTHSLLNLGWF